MPLSDEQLDQLFEEKQDELYRHILNKYPAQLIDLNEYIFANVLRLRKRELQGLYDKRRGMEQLLQKAKDYFKEKEEGV